MSKRSRSGRSRRRSSQGRARATSQVQETPVDFSTEYRYVLSDLKRFAILAVAMLTTLVVLALALG